MDNDQTGKGRIIGLGDRMNFSIFLLFAMLALAFGCHKAVQGSSGMDPTIKAGEKVTINDAAYVVSNPSRWDVVALRQPGFTNLIVLKRVIALPSETVSLTSTGIVVNAKPLVFPANLSNVVYCPPEKSWRGGSTFVKFPYSVPPDQYFLVGDNWSNSLDSRYYGAVPMTNILGKVLNK
jgi:signal peptidase I